MDSPVVNGTVRLDGAATFPVGWQPGSWSFAEKYEHVVVVIQCVYRGQHVLKEYAMSEITRKPNLSGRRGFYTLYFGNITAYIKAPSNELQKLDDFIQLLTSGCNNIDCSMPPSPVKVLQTPSLFVNTTPLARAGKALRRSVRRSPLTKTDNVDTTPEKENNGIFNSPSSSHVVPKFYSNGISEQRQSSSYQTRSVARRLASESTPPAAGFSNLGNTCYMNSILQAVLGQKPFSQELWRAVVKNKSSIPDGSLLRLLVELLRIKNGDASVDKPHLLQAIKDKVAATAGRFNDHSEHDAQEFLVLLLDQLADEVERLNVSDSQMQILNPVLRNFAFSICHYLKCKECDAICSREEQFFDLPLNITGFASGDCSQLQSRHSLQTLVSKFFLEETISYTCAHCGCSETVVHHRITKLPRILILHVKRYKYNEESRESEKAKNAIGIPTFLTLQDYCVADAFDSADLTASTKKLTSFQTLSPGMSNADFRFSTRRGSSSTRRRLFEDNDSLNISLSKRSAEEPLSGVPKRPALSTSAEYPMEEELIVDDDFNDSEYQKQLSEAIRQSLLESSNRDMTTDSMDSVDAASFFCTNSVLSEIEENETEGFLPRSFRLSAVVSHIGYSSTTGHYVSDVFDWKERDWYCYDDSTVSRTSEHNVQKKREKNGYIFFYVDKKLLLDVSTDDASAATAQ
uniref:Ubiquitin carboxyl-terminal hydrolase n=1 Tax=Trichuris muris TaxID=70415 RepID=A0A5S6QK77_TRIMR